MPGFKGRFYLGTSTVCAGKCAIVLLGALGFGKNALAQPNAMPPQNASASETMAWSKSWTSEEMQWVHRVLLENKDIAQQRLKGQMATVARETAQGGLKPKWTLSADLNYYPQAKNSTATGLGLLPGQTLAEHDQSVQVSQILPTGGEAFVRAQNGNVLPKSGAWSDTQSVAVGLRQPLIKGFGANSSARYSLAQSKIDESLAATELKAKILDVIADARTQYWTVALALYQLQALQADSLYWHQALVTAEARKRLGDLAEDEYLGFRIDALSSRQGLLEGRRHLKQSIAKLFLLLHPESELQPEWDFSPSSRTVDSLFQSLRMKWQFDLESIPEPIPIGSEDLERMHPALLRMAQLQRKTELTLAKSRKDRLPDLGLALDWTKPMGGDASTRVGAYFTWEWPSLAANQSMRQALLQIESQKLDSLQTRREMQNNLARLHDQFQTQLTGFLLVREKVELERTRSRIAQRRYELGDLTFTDLELSARNRLKAEQEVASAYVALRLLVVEMERWNGVSLAQSGVRLEGETW
jgi:outer membrane protein TolC